MTVAELIEVLRKQPQDLTVVIDARQVEITENDVSVSEEYFADGTAVVYIDT